MLWLKLGLSGLLLAFLAWTLDLGSIVVVLNGADWSMFVAACLCLILGQFLSAIRWAWLARGLGLTVLTARKIQLYFLGMFLSLFLPSIIGGDVARGWLLAKGKKDAGWPAAASVVLERLNGVLALMLVVSLCMFFLDIPVLWIVLWDSGLLVLLLLICSTPWWWPRLLVAGWFEKHQKIAGWKSLQLNSSTFYMAWWKSLPVSLLFQALVVQAHVFLGMAVGLELTWPVYGFMVCLIALASALPLSFNGFGIREAGYIGLVSWFGGSTEAAAAMAALWVLVLLIAALPGSVVLWRMGGTNILKKA
ncbi:MAG: lysylphosphatidylglycerol synthase transmembrane domain-containing protein [Mariprofundus sp.]|nr:lysylphosphatidylglycerol synthase transmembrane domain-containing protein [Mariprofundus sp.]